MTEKKKACATCKWCLMPTLPYPASLAMCGNGRGMLIKFDPEKVVCAKHDLKN